MAETEYVALQTLSHEDAANAYKRLTSASPELLVEWTARLTEVAFATHYGSTRREVWKVRELCRFAFQNAAAGDNPENLGIFHALIISWAYLREFPIVKLTPHASEWIVQLPNPCPRRSRNDG